MNKRAVNSGIMLAKIGKWFEKGKCEAQKGGKMASHVGKLWGRGEDLKKNDYLCG